MKKIAITTGDPDGIGPEVTFKALKQIGPQNGFCFYVFRDTTSRNLFHGLHSQFNRRVVPDLKTALSLSVNSKTLIEIESNDPVSWVEDSTRACLKKDLHGLVTGPLSKKLIHDSGRRELGHTEILKKITKSKAVFQGYLGEKFHVVLATAHLPIKKVSTALKPKLLRDAIKAALQLKKILPSDRRSKPLALIGLNPHAGEGGLIGTEERHMTKLIQSVSQVSLVGPLVPDAAFSPLHWKKYSVFIASYHDQGLIPFKMIHGQNGGAQVSLGLPIIRTSVDHGTAKDIFGKNQANPGSMVDAIKWCQRLVKGK